MIFFSKSVYIRHLRWLSLTTLATKGKKARSPSVGCRSWSRFLAVSLQVTWVINQAVGCRYFAPGLQLPLQPLRAAAAFAAWWTEAWRVWTVCLRLLPDSVATAVWSQALLHSSPARYHSATKPPCDEGASNKITSVCLSLYLLSL